MEHASEKKEKGEKKVFPASRKGGKKGKTNWGRRKKEDALP